MYRFLYCILWLALVLVLAALTLENDVCIPGDAECDVTEKNDVTMRTDVKNSNDVAKKHDVGEGNDVTKGNNITEENNDGPPPKLILFSTLFFSHRDFAFGLGREPFVEAGCPVDNCIASNNGEDAGKADALVYHMRNVRSPYIGYDRKPHQRYVFFLLEPPYHLSHDLTRYPSVFNLTMTYRIDSDIPIPYGEFVPREPEASWIPLQNLTKTRLVAWFVSNCNTHSKREAYVQELQKYIPVDVYGRCGNMTCTAKQDCYGMLERDYKFYLAFENNFCLDYVTEKLYRILRRQIVPVVLGGADYRRLAPPDSLIDAQDFRSPRDLAAYLHKLDRDDHAYQQYFDWKQKYRIVDENETYKQGFCKLCELLHDPTYPNKTYNDLNDWWGKTKYCDLNVTDRILARQNNEHADVFLGH